MALRIDRLKSLFSRKPRALPQPQTTLVSHPDRPDRRRPKGWSGTRLHGGRVRREEPNADLQGKEWAIAVMAQLRTDDATQAAWEAVSSTLLSATWHAAPGLPGDEFSEQLAADFNAMVGIGGKPGRMRRAWEAIVADLIFHDLVGFRYAEPRWAFRAAHGTDLVDLEDRDPRAHDRWITDGHQLIEVVQDPVNADGTRNATGRAPVIPADELLLLTRGGTGLNFEGRGLARASYWPAKSKSLILDMINVAAERYGFATPMMTVLRSEASAAGVADDDLDAQAAAARQNLALYLAQDASYLEQAEFVKFEKFGGDLNASGLLDVTRYYDTAIFRCFLVQFLTVGTSDVGSKSAGEVQETFFRRSTVNALDRIAAGMGGKSRPGGGVIGRWVTFNHGPSVDPSLYPVLCHSGLDVDKLVQLIPSLAALTAAGWARSDRRARNVLRARGGLPPEDVDEDGAADADGDTADV